MESESGRSFQEACEELGIGAYELRRLIERFPAFLSPSDGEPEASRGYLSPVVMHRLAKVIELREQGMEDDRVVQMLASTQTVAATAPLDQSQSGALVTRIELLENRLEALERRLVDDRDRTLTAFARLQQEIQTLENELAIKESRQARKKKGLFGG